MTSTFDKKARKDPALMREYQRERAIIEVTELFAEHMGKKGISRAELARKLGRTKGYITQIMSGRNLTIHTISDVLWALGESLCTTSVPLTFGYCEVEAYEPRESAPPTFKILWDDMPRGPELRFIMDHSGSEGVTRGPSGNLQMAG